MLASIIREVCKTFTHRFDSGPRLHFPHQYSSTDSVTYGDYCPALPLDCITSGIPPIPNHSEPVPSRPATVLATCSKSGVA